MVTNMEIKCLPLQAGALSGFLDCDYNLNFSVFNLFLENSILSSIKRGTGDHLRYRPTQTSFGRNLGCTAFTRTQCSVHSRIKNRAIFCFKVVQKTEDISVVVKTFSAIANAHKYLRTRCDAPIK